ATVFAGIDRVMDSGHDPRRFLTDLLERFRDLVVIGSVPDAVSSGLIEVPDEEAERLAAQAGQFGQADLVRLAEVVDRGITAMKGATPTRLQLEMVCARLLLPGADDSERGLQARLDRLERRMTLSPDAYAAAGASATPEERPRAGAVAPAPEKSPAATAATAIDTQQPTGATATGAPHPAEPPTLATDAAQAALAAQSAEPPGTPESA